MQKPDVVTDFWNPDFCISKSHVPKALFHSNTNIVLQIVFELAREAIHCIPMVIKKLHDHNLQILYIYIWSWNKDHSIQ